MKCNIASRMAERYYMEEDHRIELSPFPVDRISSPVSFQSIDLPELERAAGIEPAIYPWQGYVLPLAPCPLVLLLYIQIGLMSIFFTALTLLTL